MAERRDLPRRKTTRPPSPGAAPGIARRELSRLERTIRLSLRLLNPAPSSSKIAGATTNVKTTVGSRTLPPPFAVAAGILPAVEPGVSPGGMAVRVLIMLEASSVGPGGKMQPSTAGKLPAATVVRNFGLPVVSRSVRLRPCQLCPIHQSS